jgi:hypothetical protein
MKFRIYIRVEGASSEVASFELAIRERVAGKISYRNHNGAPFMDVPLEYWKSEELCVVSGHPEDALLKLLQEAQAALEAAIAAKKLNVTAVIISEYSDDELPRGGYFLSRDLVSCLSALGAELDIDSVPLIA